MRPPALRPPGKRLPGPAEVRRGHKRGGDARHRLQVPIAAAAMLQVPPTGACPAARPPHPRTLEATRCSASATATNEAEAAKGAATTAAAGSMFVAVGRRSMCLGAALAGGKLERDCWRAGPGPSLIRPGRKVGQQFCVSRTNAGAGMPQRALWALCSGAARRASLPPGLGGLPPVAVLVQCCQAPPFICCSLPACLVRAFTLVGQMRRYV